MGFFHEVSATALGRIFLSGAVVNFVLIIIGGLIGCFLKKGIPERVTVTLMNGMALCVFYIGVAGCAQDGANTLIIILSFATGSIIGELIDFDRLVNRLGDKLEIFMNKNGSKTKIAEGFVTATLLFCVGAMSIVGSIDSGINGDNSTLYSKSLIDGVTAVALSSTLGMGVALSALPVIVLEGGLTLLAFAVAPMLTTDIITQMSVIGSLMIIAISFNMLKLTKIKVMNYLPAIFMPIIFCTIIK